LLSLFTHDAALHLEDVTRSTQGAWTTAQGVEVIEDVGKVISQGKVEPCSKLISDFFEQTLQ
jgi:hypothetical protein